MSNLGLSAFYQCALKQNMTEAASLLGVTQSALSQRIASLEDDLETSLFIREAKALKLTGPGQELLEYCRFQASLEDEILAKFKSENSELCGTVRLGAYSSVLRSMIFPKMTGFLRQNSKVLVDFKAYEVHQLLGALKSNRADIVICDSHFNLKGIKEHVIGKEEYVVIESTKYKTPKDLYFDHDHFDSVTDEFFQNQNNSQVKFKRAFMGDVYGIIDAVEQGLGRAVMSRHMIENNKKIKVISGFKKMERPVVMSYLERPYYSESFKGIISTLL